MKRTNVGMLVWALIALVASPVRAGESEISLLARTGWVHLHLVLGRIEVANIGSSQTRTATRGEPDDDVRETLTISSETTIPTVRYQMQTSDENLAFSIVNGQHVELQRTSLGGEATELRFQQSPRRKVVLEVSHGTTKNTYRAPSLWHLVLEKPAVCEQELLPVLQWLQPRWRLQEFIHRTEDELVLEATSSDFKIARNARQLVGRLDHSDYRRRQAALSDLRALGIGLLPYLNQLDPADLSREQRQRLARLKAELRADTNDTPERMAKWLVEDERAWLTLLTHREQAIRSIAVAHLGKRFPKTFATDISAGSETQVRRVAKLKAKYELR